MPLTSPAGTAKLYPKMNVILTQHLSRCVIDEVAVRYRNASEVIQEALRKMEERELRSEPPALQGKITEGFNTRLSR